MLALLFLSYQGICCLYFTLLLLFCILSFTVQLFYASHIDYFITFALVYTLTLHSCILLLHSLRKQTVSQIVVLSLSTIAIAYSDALFYTTLFCYIMHLESTSQHYYYVLYTFAFYVVIYYNNYYYYYNFFNSFVYYYCSKF